MKNNQVATVFGTTASPLFLLFITFLVLKLTSVINWSWWWVTAPLWGPWAIIISFLVVCVVIWLLAVLLIAGLNIFETKRQKNKSK